jgi:ribonuclease III
MRADLEILEARIGHHFTDREILIRALTHSSYVNDRLPRPPEPGRRDNQQLEFLGDAVLGLVVSETLLQRFPEAREGDLSQRKATLVSATHLYCVARRLELGEFLELGRGEEMSGGRVKKTLLADAMEALIAAVYLDGGFAAGQRLIVTYVLETEDDPQLFPALVPPKTRNFKGSLVELSHSMKLPPPRYVLLKEQGPEQAKVFTVEARLGKEYTAQATGRTKKLAEQRAARALYERLRGELTQSAETEAEPGLDVTEAQIREQDLVDAPEVPKA